MNSTLIIQEIVTQQRLRTPGLGPDCASAATVLKKIQIWQPWRKQKKEIYCGGNKPLIIFPELSYSNHFTHCRYQLIIMINPCNSLIFVSQNVIFLNCNWIHFNNQLQRPCVH